jgi:cytochrome c556
MATEAGPELLAKLPLAFKQMGMSVHRDFDGLADLMASSQPPPRDVLSRLAGITARCTTCHDLYRLPSPQVP